MCRLEHYSLGLYEKAIPIGLPFRDKLKAARMAGYDFVEMRHPRSWLGWNWETAGAWA